MPEALGIVEKALDRYEAACGEIRKNLTWLKEEEFLDLEDKVKETKDWLANITAEQNKL